MTKYFLFSLFILFTACQEQAKSTIAPKKTKTYKKIQGVTMGVVAYRMTYQDDKNKVSQPIIDSLLAALNKGNSHYDLSLIHI